MRLIEGDSRAVRRGFILLTIMMAFFSMAMAYQQNIVTNYYEDILHLTGPEFGYITAIREVPGFLLIGVAALFYKMSLPKLTALALLAQAVGYLFFGASNSFWTVTPWVIISSMGYHTVMQTEYALGMSLTEEKKAGSILGKLTSIGSFGSLAAMAVVLVTFHYKILSYRPSFVVAGGLALVAAAAIFTFPNLHNGREQKYLPTRAPIVFKKPYRLYYYLCLFDGARAQIFFSFGLWVLVNRYDMTVPQISVLLIAVEAVRMVSSTWIGRKIDQLGEKQMLIVMNVAYIVALAGYALGADIAIAIACYAIYSLISGFSAVGEATYIRKIASSRDVAPSLAMGVTLRHAAAIVVPVATGFILNFVGYQIPFLVACVFAAIAIVVARQLNPLEQRTPEKIAEDEALAGIAVAVPAD